MNEQKVKGNRKGQEEEEERREKVPLFHFLSFHGQNQKKNENGIRPDYSNLYTAILHCTALHCCGFFFSSFFSFLFFFRKKKLARYCYVLLFHSC